MSQRTDDVIIDSRAFDAAIFDVDGVITKTASVHATAWKRLFDEYRDDRLRRALTPFEPFDVDTDYRLYVDGRPRYDGVQAFLASRSISLPWGDPSDPDDAETICGLGNRKDSFFLDAVRRDGVQPYRSTVALITALKAHGVKVGVFSASRNAVSILTAAGVLDLFDAKLDGVDAEQLHLEGKPDPSMLLELTRRIGSTPTRTVVSEDAVAGVQAGRAGGFALVIGVNRTPHPGALLAEGADREVSDLGSVTVA